MRIEHELLASPSDFNRFQEKSTLKIPNDDLSVLVCGRHDIPFDNRKFDHGNLAFERGIFVEVIEFNFTASHVFNYDILKLAVKRITTWVN